MNSQNRTLLSPTFTTTGGPVVITFRHQYNFETFWDGGVVSYALGAGSPTYVPTGAFSEGGYNQSSIVASFPSLAAGAAGFSGNPGLLVTSSANLGSFAAGQSLVIRFEAAWDGIILNPFPNWRITEFSISGVNEGTGEIPEPGTMVLAAIGLGALWMARRRVR